MKPPRTKTEKTNTKRGVGEMERGVHKPVKFKQKGGKGEKKIGTQGNSILYTKGETNNRKKKRGKMEGK